MDLLIATSNRGKANELTRLLHLEAIEMRLLTLADVSVTYEPEETGTTFAENAAIKAADYAVQTGLWTLAEDSGLEVAALGGRPGVLSARYGGSHLDHPAKMRFLLDELVPHSDRSARFASAAVLASPSRKIVASAYGECRGRIAEAPRGTNGFGYDPIFIPDGFERTFAELSDMEKNSISHRARALEKIIPFLRALT